VTIADGSLSATLTGMTGVAALMAPGIVAPAVGLILVVRERLGVLPRGGAMWCFWHERVMEGFNMIGHVFWTFFPEAAQSCVYELDYTLPILVVVQAV